MDPPPVGPAHELPVVRGHPNRSPDVTVALKDDGVVHRDRTVAVQIDPRRREEVPAPRGHEGSVRIELHQITDAFADQDLIIELVGSAISP